MWKATHLQSLLCGTIKHLILKTQLRYRFGIVKFVRYNLKILHHCHVYNCWLNKQYFKFLYSFIHNIFHITCVLCPQHVCITHYTNSSNYSLLTTIKTKLKKKFTKPPSHTVYINITSTQVTTQNHKHSAVTDSLFFLLLHITVTRDATVSSTSQSVRPPLRFCYLYEMKSFSNTMVLTASLVCGWRSFNIRDLRFPQQWWWWLLKSSRILHHVVDWDHDD